MSAAEHQIIDIAGVVIIVILSVYSVRMTQLFNGLLDDYSHLWRMNR